jgi:hypothetical protein
MTPVEGTGEGVRSSNLSISADEGALRGIASSVV